MSMCMENRDMGKQHYTRAPFQTFVFDMGRRNIYILNVIRFVHKKGFDCLWGFSWLARDAFFQDGLNALPKILILSLLVA